MKTPLNVVVTAVAIAALAACSRPADAPRPTHTLQPSAEPTQSPKPATNRETACSLMTAEERQALAGTTMDQVVPSNPITAEHQCRWVHSLKETVRISIAIEAMPARDWARRSASSLGSSLGNQALGKKRLETIRKGVLDARSPNLTPERACEIYQLVMTLYGFEEGQEVLYPAGNSQMTSIVTSSCVNGAYTSLTYAEQNLYPVPSLGELVLKSRQAVEKRSAERFGADADPSASPTPSRVR